MGAGATHTTEASATARRVLPFLVAVALFLENLDTSILNTAVPTISAALHIAPLSMKAVLASYTLSLAVFIPVSGWMADNFGTRRVFASAIGVFTAASCLCGLVSDIHLLVACRVLQGCGGAMMVPVGRIALLRTFAKSDLVRTMAFVSVPALIGPMLGPLVGGLIVAYLHWRVIFFVNVPIGIAGVWLVFRLLPDYRAERTHPLDVVGLILFGAGVALLSYVLEVFGEHALSARESVSLFALAVSLIAGYAVHASHLRAPLLQLKLLRIRTFATAVGGGLITRLGLGGVPFLLPLLYQVGLGFTPVQSGLLIMPQALASMSTKAALPRVLAWLGYRGVLASNTLLLGLMLIGFATIGVHTPVWLIALQAFCYGACTSLQYTSMNTLTYANINADQTSRAGSIASTVQQMALSFGVASAALATAVFVPDRFHASPPQMISGIHRALVCLGLFTMASTVVFRTLRPDDGANVSQARVEPAPVSGTPS